MSCVVRKELCISLEAADMHKIVDHCDDAYDLISVVSRAIRKLGDMRQSNALSYTDLRQFYLEMVERCDGMEPRNSHMLRLMDLMDQVANEIKALDVRCLEPYRGTA